MFKVKEHIKVAHKKSSQSPLHEKSHDKMEAKENKPTKEEEDIIKMMATAVPDSKYDYRCKLDPKHNKGQPFQDKESLRVHYNKFHKCQKPENFENLINKPHSTWKIFHCRNCNLRTKTLKVMRDHIKTDHEIKSEAVGGKHYLVTYYKGDTEQLNQFINLDCVDLSERNISTDGSDDSEHEEMILSDNTSIKCNMQDCFFMCSNLHELKGIIYFTQHKKYKKRLNK